MIASRISLTSLLASTNGYTYKHCVQTMDDDGLGRSRQFNRLRLLRTLLSEPAQSRAELGQGLGVSRATITALLTELEHAGMVEQQFDATPEERRRSIGRPPLQISLSPTAAYAVGLDFGHRHVRAAVCDLAGEIVADGWSAASVDDDPAGSLDLAQRLTGEVLADAGVDVSRVIGVGAGFAAPVNPATGSIYAEDILPGWSDIEPAAELEARLGLPVLIDTGAHAGAMGEHLFGAGRGVDHMAYVRLSAGVGLGLILGGSPYRGANGLAGELGHISFGEDGVPSGHVLIPARPYFIGLFLGQEEPFDTPYQGRYFHEGGRFVCVGNPPPSATSAARSWPTARRPARSTSTRSRASTPRSG